MSLVSILFTRFFKRVSPLRWAWWSQWQLKAWLVSRMHCRGRSDVVRAPGRFFKLRFSAHFLHTSQHITTDIRSYTVIHSDTQWYDTGGSRPFAISSGIGDFAMLPRSYLLLLEPDIHNHGLQLWSDFDLSEFHEFCDLRIFNIFTLFEEYMCVCAHLHTNDPTLCISQWCVFSRDVWSLLEPFGAFSTSWHDIRMC